MRILNIPYLVLSYEIVPFLLVDNLKRICFNIVMLYYYNDTRGSEIMKKEFIIHRPLLLGYIGVVVMGGLYLVFLLVFKSNTTFDNMQATTHNVSALDRKSVV